MLLFEELDYTRKKTKRHYTLITTGIFKIVRSSTLLSFKLLKIALGDSWETRQFFLHNCLNTMKEKFLRTAQHPNQKNN